MLVSKLSRPDLISCRECGHVMTRKRALELLPPFMGLPPDHREQVVQAVHTLVDRFPSDSHDFDAGTTQASWQWYALLIGLRCPASLWSACMVVPAYSLVFWSAPEQKHVQRPAQCSARADFPVAAKPSAVLQALDYATQLMALMDAIMAAARMQHDVTPLLSVSLVPFVFGAA